MCSFHVGQKVVYVGDDRIFDPNPGKTIHTIQSIQKSCCTIRIDVGIRHNHIGVKCSTCGEVEESDIFWKKSTSFRPLIEDYTEEEVEAVNIDELVEELCEPVTQ